MSVIYGEEDEQGSVEGPEPDQYERQQASFAAEFNAKVIAAQQSQLVSDENERGAIRKVLADSSTVQLLASELAKTNDDVRSISAQQSHEEYAQMRDQIDGGR